MRGHAVTRLPGTKFLLALDPSGLAKYGLDLVVVGVPTDITDATAADSFVLSLGVAAGNTLEAVVGAYLINVWSQGRKTFDTPAGVTKFALVGLGPSTMIGAIVGTGSLYFAGDVDWGNLIAIGARWWLRDAAGALVITPAVVLWA